MKRRNSLWPTAAVLVLITVLQAGCGGLLAPKPDLTRYYLLASLSEMGRHSGPEPSEPSTAVPASVGLGPIRLPGYLDRERIVVRASANRLELLDLSRWAEPLEQSLYRVMAENLSGLLGTNDIRLFPFSGPAPEVKLQIDIRRFEPSEDYSATLVACWFIKDGESNEVLACRETRVTKPARDRSISGAVGALSEALGELSVQVAAAVRSIRHPGPATAAGSGHDAH